MRRIFAFLLAVFCSAFLSSLFSSQLVLWSLLQLGVDIPVTTWILFSCQDIFSLQTLAPVIAIGFLCAFAVGAVLHAKLGGRRTVWFPLVGAVALLTAFISMETLLSLSPLAGARTSFGLTLQALAGAVGGLVFARFS